MTEESPVRYYRRGGAGHIVLNRPEYRNAQNSAMTYAIDDAFRQAVDDDDVKVIVLSGAGEHFSAGHDIGSPGRDVEVSFDRRAVMWWDHVGRPEGEKRFAREQEVYLGMCRRWRETPKPVIAMVRGACIAGGLMLAWIADFIICDEDAFFGDPVLKMGVPGVEYFAHPWAMGPRAAKQFLFTGDRMDAQRAFELGMVNEVVAVDELESRVDQIVERISGMSRFALALTKKAVNQCEDSMGLTTAMDGTFALHQLGHLNMANTSTDHLGGATVSSMKQA